MRFRSFIILLISLLLLGSVKVRAQEFNPSKQNKSDHEKKVLTFTKRKLLFVSDYVPVPEKFTMMQKQPKAPKKISENAIQLMPKKESPAIDPELLEAVKLYASAGSFLEMRTRVADRITKDTRYVSTSLSVEVGETNWYVKTGVYMNGWYDPNLPEKIYDAMLKYEPGAMVNLAGYSPVVGVEKFFGKKKRGKVSILYGTAPPASGVRVWSKDTGPRQVQVSGSMLF